MRRKLLDGGVELIVQRMKMTDVTDSLDISRVCRTRGGGSGGAASRPCYKARKTALLVASMKISRNFAFGSSKNLSGASSRYQKSSDSQISLKSSEQKPIKIAERKKGRFANISSVGILEISAVMRGGDVERKAARGDLGNEVGFMVVRRMTWSEEGGSSRAGSPIDRAEGSRTQTEARADPEIAQ
jgi:hypothetical protein